MVRDEAREDEPPPRATADRTTALVELQVIDIPLVDDDIGSISSPHLPQLLQMPVDLASGTGKHGDLEAQGVRAQSLAQRLG